MTRRLPRRSATLHALALVALFRCPAAAAFPGQLAPLTAPPGNEVNVVIKSQHRRLVFTQNVQRLAVGDSEILSAELITSREVLLLGRDIGRTTLIIWFANGSSREYLFSVQRDLSVLERALKLVNPSIEVESAPDRDALILTGIVPDVLTKQKAEAIAIDYLEAGGTRRGAAQAILGAPAAQTGVTTPEGAPPSPPGAAQLPLPQAPATVAPSTSQLQGTVTPSGKVINLLQVTSLPALPEEKIRAAIQTIGGEHVTIRRLLRGDVPDNPVNATESAGANNSRGDTLVLEGRVPNQVVLVRVLTIAAKLFAGTDLSQGGQGSGINVLADEAGALVSQGQGQGAQQSQSSLGGGGGASSSLFGGSRGARLTNQVQTNVGRAKAISVAGGRILSFIEVTDLPQVRVDIRLEEINRTKLRAFNPNSALALSNFRQPSLNPAQSATAVQGDQAARVGSSGAAIQNVLSFLNGGLLNELQYSGAHAAIDATLSLLEREGIAQSLSSPSLTVLSGEVAQVQVGGEVPVPTAFAPAFGGAAAAGGATPGVFSGTEFVPFGVSLQIRPLVGDDDTITLDVQPLVVLPDSVLTDTIRQSTGAALTTTAFQTRGLRTSSRLQDGQALLIGGLTSNNSSTNVSSTPGIRETPILGWLFQGLNRNDQTTELIVVVNPVLVRTPVPDVALWAFPERDELIKSVMSRSQSPPKP